MANVIAGHIGITRLPTERTWSAKKGWTTEERYIGPHEAVIKVASATQQERGSRVSLRISPKDGGLSELSITLDSLEDNKKPEKSNGEPEPDSDSWSLDINDYEKDLWTHSSANDLWTNYPTQYNWLRTTLPIIRSKGTWKDWDDYLVANGYTTATGWAEMYELYKLFQQGIESYTISQFVLKRQRVFSQGNAGSLQINNVNKSFTLDQLKSKEGLPDGLFFAVPAGGYWLKRGPKVSLKENKYDGSNEYWHADDWSSTLYARVT